MKNLGTHFKNFDSEGTVFGSINKKDFEALPVVVPCQGVLVAFDEISKALDGSIELNEQKIRRLVEIRDTLLPRLISGQLQTEEAQHSLQEVES
jgi:type I restriction enzyme S subunit